MPRLRRNEKPTSRFHGIDLRKLRKELKLIPFDIKREMRFLDLLFSERNIVRTQAEREVLRDLIDRASDSVKFYQSRLVRFQECYNQFKEKKSFDNTLLFPDEVQTLQKWTEGEQNGETHQRNHDMRTGTDG
jgi:hypothetical protein